jgi:hypothetical protein
MKRNQIPDIINPLSDSLGGDRERHHGCGSHGKSVAGSSEGEGQAAAEHTLSLPLLR